MSGSPTAVTDLTSQYTAQVANDLERNVKEQERVTAEIAALQEQLAVLRHDHALLVTMRQALGLAAAPAEPADTPGPVDTSEGVAPPEPVDTPEAADTAAGGATVPAPRGRSGAGTRAGRPKRTKKAGARTASGKSAGRSSAARADRSEARTARPEGPKLVELVRRHLDEQSEPRSAAEIAGALGQAHPERTIRTTVVRNTLEGLVARNRAQRTKQGSSVFYTAPDGTGRTAADEEAARA
ncbi:hypothetical protein [Streptomyces sp. Tu 3180]|uniref:hypothetical protein n=1 Tax=Streptomyces sp. Tu 3180 TaxID=2682611 RepID=UPI0013574ACC|nr:hypothetical protein [Streptomyces sp. Tu 3180]KAF3463639.1 hypothetical protein GL259_04510 [Streptomyces sp. Tu 3180]